MRADGEVDLRRSMEAMQRLQSLKAMTDAAQPIADIFEPPSEGMEARPLVDWLKDVPDRILVYVHKMAKLIHQQVLSLVKSFYPTAKLELVGRGIANDCTSEKFTEYKH